MMSVEIPTKVLAALLAAFVAVATMSGCPFDQTNTSDGGSGSGDWSFDEDSGGTGSGEDDAGPVDAGGSGGSGSATGGSGGSAGSTGSTATGGSGGESGGSSGSSGGATSGGSGSASGGSTGGSGKECESNADCPEGSTCNLISDSQDDNLPPTRRCGAPRCDCDGQENAYCSKDIYQPCVVYDPPCQLNGCPDGFDCHERTRLCECNGFGPNSRCEPLCQSDSDCDRRARYPWICVDGECEAVGCTSDSDCSDGRICAAYGDERICERPGSYPNEAACKRNADCQSGMCYQGFCVEPCVENSECPSGKECVEPDDFDTEVPYCRTPKCGNCASDEYCDARSSRCFKDPCPDSNCDDY